MRGVALKYFGANHHQDEGQRPEIIVEQIVVKLK